jgi:Holliday junction resolvase-like predicted endonuclease
VNEQRLEKLQARFDVVAVLGDGESARIQHIAAAFDADGW